MQANTNQQIFGGNVLNQNNYLKNE